MRRFWAVAAALAGGAAAQEKPYEYDLSRFRKVDPAWIRYAELPALPAAVEAPAALALDAQDRLYVAGAQRLAVFDAAGRPVGGFALEAPARCLALARSGEVLAGGKDQIRVYAPSGGVLAAWVPLGEEALLTSLAVARNGDVWVADSGNRAVWRFDAAGRLLGRLAPPNPAAARKHFIVPSPSFDVAAAPDGTLWVANPGRQRVEHYAADGQWLGAWGEASMRLEGFPGCCNPTHLAVLPDGRILTSEKGIPRVKCYRPDGALEAVVAPPECFAEGALGLDLAADSTGRVWVLDPARGQVRRFEPRRE